MSTDRGAARGNLTHFAVPEAREMLFDEMPSCPAYGGLSFDGIAVNADDQLYLIVRTRRERAYTWALICRPSPAGPKSSWWL